MGKCVVVKEPINGKIVMNRINAKEEKNRTVNDRRAFLKIIPAGLFFDLFIFFYAVSGFVESAKSTAALE